MTWIVAGFLALVLSGISYRTKLLTRDGAIAAFVIGFILYGFGQLAFCIPVLYFFISSNLLGRLKRKRPGQSNEKESRNSFQVLANGFLPAIFTILWAFYQDPVFILFFLTAICTATSDTWATELGVLSPKPPRSILNFKEVEKGSSGGVSLLGTIAACAGAFTNCQLAAFNFQIDFYVNLSFQQVLGVTLIAVLAQFIDSLLGACCQVRYLCAECGLTVETPGHCKKPSAYKSGFRWLTNDMVNFLSILAGIFILWLFLKISYF